MARHVYATDFADSDDEAGHRAPPPGALPPGPLPPAAPHILVLAAAIPARRRVFFHVRSLDTAQKKRLSLLIGDGLPQLHAKIEDRFGSMTNFQRLTWREHPVPHGAGAWFFTGKTLQLSDTRAMWITTTIAGELAAVIPAVPSLPVFILNKRVESLLGIPAAEHALLLRGLALLNYRRLDEYGIDFDCPLEIFVFGSYAATP